MYNFINMFIIVNNIGYLQWFFKLFLARKILLNDTNILTLYTWVILIKYS